MSNKTPTKCENCGQTAVVPSRECGVKVCVKCEYHQGMVRCFCGWAADGGDGYQQLQEMGETIEPEDY
jgi:hypothetical protein